MNITIPVTNSIFQNLDNIISIYGEVFLEIVNMTAKQSDIFLPKDDNDVYSLKNLGDVKISRSNLSEFYKCFSENSYNLKKLNIAKLKTIKEIVSFAISNAISGVELNDEDFTILNYANYKFKNNKIGK